MINLELKYFSASNTHSKYKKNVYKIMMSKSIGSESKDRGLRTCRESLEDLMCHFVEVIPNQTSVNFYESSINLIEKMIGIVSERIVNKDLALL